MGYKVFVADNPPEAHLVAEALLAEGIDAEVENENLFVLRGDVPFTDNTLPTVTVAREEEIPKAKEIVESYIEARKAARVRAGGIACPRCGSIDAGRADSGGAVLLAAAGALSGVMGGLIVWKAVIDPHDRLATVFSACVAIGAAAFLIWTASSIRSGRRSMKKCRECGKEWKVS